MESTLLLVLVLAAVIVPSFLIQRKQRRRLDQMRQMQEALSIGDEVVTTAGLHATVVGVSDETVELEIAPNVVCVWERFGILRKLE